MFALRMRMCRVRKYSSDVHHLRRRRTGRRDAKHDRAERRERGAGERVGQVFEMEESRREWLDYYMAASDWIKAAELVVTMEEREKLAALQRMRANP